MASLALSLPGRYKDECSIAGLSGWREGSGGALCPTAPPLPPSEKFTNGTDVSESHEG